MGISYENVRSGDMPERGESLLLVLDLDLSNYIWQPINLFIEVADHCFGTVTTIRRNGKVEKKIRWDAFRLFPADWQRVEEVRDILDVCFCFLRFCFY